MGRRNSAAVRALRARSRIRNRASHTEAKPGRGALLLAHDIGNEEHQLLGADADPVSVLEGRPSDESPSVELRSVATVEVFQARFRPRQVDSNVSSGQHRIIDRHVAHRASAHDDLVADQIDFLKMKTQPVSQTWTPHEPSG